MSVCQYCPDPKDHQSFPEPEAHPPGFLVYLLSDRRFVETGNGHRAVPLIDFAVNPGVAASAANRKGPQCGKCTQLAKEGVGFYQVELIFGPLNAEQCKQMAETCRKEARKIHSRILRFCDYANVMLKRQTQEGAKADSCMPKAELRVRDKALVVMLYKARASEGGHFKQRHA